jgi:glycosyltransferase involved in cell wall biosynthesis
VQAHSITIVVPVFNEQDSLEELLRRIHGAADPSPQVSDLHIVFVDDGSTDGSWLRIAALAERDPAVTGIRLRRNFGKATALDIGIRHASSDVVFTMDADLQDDPSEIPNFLAKLDEGHDLVSGWKVNRQDSTEKVWPSRIFNFVTSRLTGVRIRDMNCGFKAYRREVFESVSLYGELHRFIPALAQAEGYRVTEIPVRHHARKYGASKYGVKRYMRGLLDLLTTLTITRYVRRPGHLFGSVGILLGTVGFLILMYLAFLKLALGMGIGDRPLLLLGMLMVLLGGQMMMFGMMAELLIHRTEPLLTRSVVAATVSGASPDERAARRGDAGEVAKLVIKSAEPAGQLETPKAVANR